MIRLLPFVVEAIILVFCLIDAIMADETRIRNLPKWAWILLIIIIPLVGGIAWLVAGRPANSVPRTPTAPQRPVGRSDWEQPPRQRPKAPDDDPEFLATLKRSNTDHERMLKQWEDDLRRREEELRKQDGPGSDPDPEPKPDDR
ncbi:MAG: PLDc_N domain-containing protein [Propionibacteriaceae bacterium]|nr:PLDc_N domain-containing protein [Propionibacteriaceae bacterium]